MVHCPAKTLSLLFHGSHMFTDSMIGDVNLYLTKEGTDEKLLVGEISLMIAEKEYRNCGRGKETALHMLRYGTDSALSYLK